MKSALSKLLNTGQLLINQITSDTSDLLLIKNSGGTNVTRFDYAGRRRVGTGSVPTIEAGAGAGTSPTVAITGDDTAGKITVTTGTSPAAGTLATATFAFAFANAPFVCLTPKDAAAAALQEYNGTSASGFSIKTAATPPASTTHTWDYMVVGA